jgi:hypothetical protein
MGRSAHRVTCENCKSVDVLRWHREGRLQAGRTFTWCWTFGDETSGRVTVHCAPDTVTLVYRIPNSVGELLESLQRISIAWTECSLGGRRPWFVCAGQDPVGCGRRAAKLYLALGGPFACRRCNGLTYASQRQGLHHRSVDRARKIRIRLGGSADLVGPFPQKPKWMHWCTYELLRQRASEAEMASTRLLAALLKRHRRQIEKTSRSRPK